MGKTINEIRKEFKEARAGKIERLWMFKITIEDTLRPYRFPEMRIMVMTIKEMRDFIKYGWYGGLKIKIQNCKKMTNNDWIYLNEWKRWWNDLNLITLDRQAYR